MVTISPSQTRDNEKDFFNFLNTFDDNYGPDNLAVVLTKNMRALQTVRTFQKVFNKLQVTGTLTVSLSYSEIVFQVSQELDEIPLPTGPVSLDSLKSGLQNITIHSEIISAFYISQEAYDNDLTELSSNISKIISERWL